MQFESGEENNNGHADASPLSYLLVLQSAGLPLYAQSFEFENDEACRSFNHIIKPKETESKKDAHLMGGFFSAMQLFGTDMVNDRLKLIELGFTNYEIIGLIRDEVFFIGIFENFGNRDNEKNEKLQFIEAIASRFLHHYPIEEIHNPFVTTNIFRGFTDLIVEYSNGSIKKQNCRDCLTRCSKENKGCLPHSFYFENVDLESADGLIYLK